MANAQLIADLKAARQYMIDHRECIVESMSMAVPDDRRQAAYKFLYEASDEALQGDSRTAPLRIFDRAIAKAEGR